MSWSFFLLPDELTLVNDGFWFWGRAWSLRIVRDFDDIDGVDDDDGNVDVDVVEEEEIDDDEFFGNAPRQKKNAPIPRPPPKGQIIGKTWTYNKQTNYSTIHN